MNVSVCNHNLKPWTPTHQSNKAEKNNHEHKSWSNKRTRTVPWSVKVVVDHPFWGCCPLMGDGWITSFSDLEPNESLSFMSALAFLGTEEHKPITQKTITLWSSRSRGDPKLDLLIALHTCFRERKRWRRRRMCKGCQYAWVCMCVFGVYLKGRGGMWIWEEEKVEGKEDWPWKWSYVMSTALCGVVRVLLWLLLCSLYWWGMYILYWM